MSTKQNCLLHTPKKLACFFHRRPRSQAPGYECCLLIPATGKVRRQGGGWREESISGCGLARDHTTPSLVQTEFGCGRRPAVGFIHEKLKAGIYRFKPARRVLIPKEGTSKMRKLGIPVVMDRIVAQSIHLVFEEIFDPEFTGSNFGFRRGKSQHRAIGHVQSMVGKGYEWCASIDLKSFFDEILHNLILKLIRRRIADERLVTLIARVLKAGVVIEGKFEKTTKGCPQGSALSPMLSNIVLNELDHELERRGHRYARWGRTIL